MWRAKSRVVGSLGMPIFFLIFLGLGLEHASMPGLPAGVDYVAFLTPGIMGVLLGAEASGVPILLDFVLITAFSIGMVGIGSYLFESTEVER